jgi:hypothetical protein
LKDPDSNQNSGVEAVVRAIIVLSLLPNMAVIQVEYRYRYPLSNIALNRFDETMYVISNNIHNTP